MYKLLVVEDEDFIRKGILEKIKQIKLPISDYYDACDYDSALSVFDRAAVDILLTDIHLQSRNGLALIQEVKKRRPKVQCIIISGYSEFEYAKRAIELSVVGYALKPVGLDVLHEQLSQAINNIKDMQKIDSKLTELKSELNLLNLIGDLNTILHSNEETESNLSKKLCGYFPDSGHYLLATINIDRCSFTDSVFTTEDIELILDLIKNIINELLFEGRKIAFHNVVQNNQLLILFILPKTCNKAEAVVLEYCRTLIELIKSTLQIHAFCSISDSLPSITQTLYLQTQERLGTRLLNVPQSTVCDSDPQTPGDLSNELSQLISSLKCFDAPKLGCNLIKLLPDYKSIGYYSAVLLELSQAIRNLSLDKKKLCTCAKTLSDAANQIGFLFNDIHELRDFCMGTITGLFPESPGEHAKSGYKISLAVKYIHSNYKNAITVNELADRYNMNCNYFSSLFKKKTEQSVVNYLTMVRLQKAKDMLKNTDLSNHEISELVGYENVQYFYKVFKKATGQTPSAFRLSETKVRL